MCFFLLAIHSALRDLLMALAESLLLGHLMGNMVIGALIDRGCECKGERVIWVVSVFSRHH